MINDASTTLELLDYLTAVPQRFPLAELKEMMADHSTGRGHKVAALAATWMHTPQPSVALSRIDWVSMFRSVGFFDIIEYGRPAPTENMLLFRGADAAGARGMSWTPDPVLAERFGPVWRCDVPASAVLARLGAQWAGQEYVVDLPDDAPVEAVR